MSSGGGDLDGKVALVTGAQQGIGRAIAVALAAAGASVAVNYYDDEKAAASVAADIASAGARALLLQGDVADGRRSAEMVSSVVAEFGQIDILVNNAGIFPRVPFLDMKEEDWDRVLGVNLKGAFFCAQAAARAMRAANRPGTILNIGSRAMMGTAPRGTHYSASKGGIASLTRAMAIELAPFGIRVNALAPGLTDTAQPRFGHSEEEMQQRSRSMPMGRMGTPQEIAEVALFLVSSRSSFILGQVVHANGGTWLG